MTTRVIILAAPQAVTHRTAVREAGFTARVIDAWVAGMASTRLVAEITVGPRPLFVRFACYRSNMGAAVEVAAAGGRFDADPRPQHRMGCGGRVLVAPGHGLRDRMIAFSDGSWKGVGGMFYDH